MAKTIPSKYEYNEIVIGGVDGGATYSNIALFNGKGEKLIESEGPGTNHWLVGMEECQSRINEMVEEAKRSANIPLDLPLTALGLSLSGCEQELTNNQLKEELQKKYPNLSKAYVVCSDTVGAVATISDSGGMVLIAGTGSNALLINPDGSIHRCGGWGHLISGEGGAYWISMKAIKIYFDDEDNYVKAPYGTNFVWKAIQEHFKVEKRDELLEHCYSRFEKSHFAGLCKLLADGAKQGDHLCLWLFAEAGRALAGYIRAVSPYAHASLLHKIGGLPVVCVGSVWLSWEYLKSTFIERLQEPLNSNGKVIEEVTLLKLNVSTSSGASYLAAKSINYKLPRSFKNTFSVFFQYKRNDVRSSF